MLTYLFLAVALANVWAALRELERDRGPEALFFFSVSILFAFMGVTA